MSASTTDGDYEPDQCIYDITPCDHMCDGCEYGVHKCIGCQTKVHYPLKTCGEVWCDKLYELSKEKE